MGKKVKAGSKIKKITWSPKQVLVKDVKPTPNNYKIKTDLGKERLNHSLSLFGIAGTVVVNTDLCLIDGNSRLEEARERGEKKIWVSVPDRKLSPKEFTEMSAMYDFAKAGEVDMDRIKGDLGSAKKFYEDWGMEVPLSLLDNLGANAPVDRQQAKELEYPENVVDPEKAIVTVQLFFTAKEEREFRKIEEVLKKRFKVDSVTDCVLKAFKSLMKK
jgi:hypothetical protein